MEARRTENDRVPIRRESRIVAIWWTVVNVRAKPEKQRHQKQLDTFDAKLEKPIVRSFERHGWDRWPRYHLARSSVVRGHDRGELRTTGGYRAARWQVLVDRIIRRLLIVRPRINSSERTRDFAARIAIHESRPCSCRSFRESPSDVSSNVSFRSFCTFTRRPREFFFARRTILLAILLLSRLPQQFRLFNFFFCFFFSFFLVYYYVYF